MADKISDKGKFDERIEYEKRTYFGTALRPVARLTGKQFSKVTDVAGGAGAFGKVRPEELIVEKDNTEYSISLANDAEESVRKIVLASIVVSVLCTVLSVLASRILKRLSR